MSEAVMRRLAKPLLFLAAFIWGTSFFIMKNTLDAVPPFWLLVFRFTTGAVLLGLFCWKKWRTHFTWDYLWRGGLFGVFLFIAYTTQTFGLTGTTPSKNAFLTATYCVLVPFLAWRVFHRRPDRYNLLAAFLCITGVGLVSLSGDLTVTWGDGLSLFSALFYALHIVAVNRLSGGKDIYLLTTVQFACHAYQYKRTPRTETLFSKPGVSYVYLIYGMYHCLNFITEPEGEPCGVLIRGAVPVDNKDSIAENRFGCKASQLTAYQKKHFLDGPGKLCKGLALTRAENALPLDRPPLYVCRGPVPQEIQTGKRIGIDYAQEAIDFPWRFWFTPGTEEGEHGLF